MKQLCLICLLTAVFFQCAAARVTESLSGRWEFRQARSQGWFPASVPGTVHTDLMASGIIPDPFTGYGERAVQWVDKEDWIYRKHFDLGPELRSCSKIDLCFDGLDTYAEVKLNGICILNADNMFRRWRLSVEGLLKPEGNELEVRLISPVKTDLPKWEAYPVHYDPGNDQSENGGLLDRKISIFARKAGYHYGWDWGPRIVTSGIWRDVRLEGWDGARISDMHFRQTEVGKKRAVLEISLEIEAAADIPDAGFRISAQGTPELAFSAALHPGTNSISRTLVIDKPELWWSLGLGSQHLYEFTTRLCGGGRELDSRRDEIGIRSIRLEREPDAGGCSFRFVLNGVPVFMKGANYIPCDLFLPRSDYAGVIESAVAAGMNMLRVWGGGTYEDDEFYSLCDRSGILIWQDFMFSCSIYPYEGSFRESVLAEAEDNVRRLRNHACIALWCGNNECSDMWYGWGVQSGTPFDSTAVAQYNMQYYQDLPAVVERCAPGSSYTPTSPWSPEGSRNLDPLSADFHYWTPWARRIASSAYEEHHSRFYSEYGYQSFPCMETIMQFAPDSRDHSVFSEMMMFHQRGGAAANKRILDKLEDEYIVPADFPSTVYLSQIAQGDIIRRAIESHRRDKPLCWGSLVWQINDCWPVASWSSRDWYGCWKPLHYYMREAYKDILVSADADGGVWIVSDRQEPVPGRLEAWIEDFDGRVLEKQGKKLKVAANASICVLKLGPGAPGQLLRMVFTDSGGRRYENLRLCGSVRDASLPGCRLEYSARQQGAGYEVRVSTDKFAKGVFLNLAGAMISGGRAANFSDNYFDLPAGCSRTVFIESPLDPDSFLQKLSVSAVNNVKPRL